MSAKEKKKTIINRGILVVLVTTGMFLTAAGSLLGQSREEVREEFHQTYPLAGGGRVSLENINGSVLITAWDRSEVRVDAVKRAYSRERLTEATIRIDAGPSSLHIKTVYPYRNQTFTSDSEGRYRNPATVEYRLTVPRSARLDTIELINGSLTIEGIAGYVKASSINGHLTAHGLTGEANLSTINGGLEATFDRLDESKPISLGSVNGGVVLTIPSNANAQIKANTVNGGIRNDFGLPVRHGKNVGHDLAGVLGRGGVRIKLGNVNGQISIRHPADNRPLSPATSLLPEKQNDNCCDENGDEIARSNREAQRAQQEAQREAARATREAQREAGRARREAQQQSARASDEARREAERARSQAQREAARVQAEAQRIAREAQLGAQREAERAQREAQLEALEAQREALHEVQRNQADIARAAREAARAQTRVYGSGGYRYSDRESRSFTVSGAPRVTLGTFDGSIVVRSWDKPEVMYTALKRANNEQALRGINVRADQRGNEISVIAEFNKSSTRNTIGFASTNAVVSLEVYVPRRANLRASSGDGHLNVDGINGEVDLRTGDGSIEVRNGRGRLLANTGDGHVSITNFDGEADARTGDGGITLDGRFTQLAARTGDGSISLALPADSNVTIETHAESVSNNGLAVPEDAGTSKHVRRWKVGRGGAVFTLRTGDGHITLRRSGNIR